MTTISFPLAKIRVAILTATVVCVGITSPVATAEESAASTTATSAVTITDTDCLTPDTASFGAIVNAVARQLRPSIPETSLELFDNSLHDLQNTLANTIISPLSVSTPTTELKGPIIDVADPMVNYIVSTLLEIRRGEHTNGLPLQNLTLNQAIETAILSLYIFSIPAKIIGSAMPSLYFVGTIFGAALSYTPRIITAAAKAIQKALSTSCVATQADQLPESAPLIPDFYPDIIPAPIKDIAEAINIASPSCPAVGDMPLSKAVSRTADYFRAAIAEDQLTVFEQQVDAFQAQLSSIRLPALLAQPQQSSDIGGLIALFDDPLITYLFGIGASTIGGHASDSIALSEMSFLNFVDLTIIATEAAWLIPTTSWSILTTILDTVSGGISGFLPDPIAPIQTVTDYPLSWYKGIIQSVCLTSDQVQTDQQ